MRRLLVPLAATAVLAAALLVPLACGSGPRPSRPSGPAPAAAATPSHAILLSVDGAGAAELWRLHQEGVFPPGGFERFFAAGEVAAALVPAEPSITAPAHVSLVTGRGADRTGIVSNELRLPGHDLLEVASGFAVPIETETLWEAARRQGRRVGIVTWPGADATDERRRGDWGMTYDAAPGYRGGVFAVTPGGEGAAEILELAAPRAGEPPLRLAVELLPGTSSRRDRVRVALPTAPPAAATAAPATSVELARGAWGEIGSGELAGWVKLLAVDPEVGRVTLYLGGFYRTPGYPERYRDELAAAGLRWPGTPSDAAFRDGRSGRPGIDLDTWSEQAERFAGFFGGALRTGIAAERWDLALAYMPIVDEAGHLLLLADRRQLGWTAEREAAYAAARRRAWLAADGELRRLLAETDLRSTAVFVVSDHGMRPVFARIHVDRLLADAGYLEAGADGKPSPATMRAWAWTTTSLANVYVNVRGREPHGTVDPADLPRLMAELKRRLQGARDGRPGFGGPLFQRVLTRDEARASGMDHPRAGDLLAWASAGYGVDEGLRSDSVVEASDGGTHGFPVEDPAMHAIYLAVGRGVEPGRPGTLRGTAVAGRVARSLGIAPPGSRR